MVRLLGAELEPDCFILPELRRLVGPHPPDCLRHNGACWSIRTRQVKFPTMTRDFFDPAPDEQNVVLVEADTLRRAERLIESCEQCNPERRRSHSTTSSIA